jgi:hypothetical protein
MKREDLSSSGILFNEEPAEEGVLPRHIDTLRTALLDFSCTIADRLELETDDDIGDIPNRCEALDITGYDSGYYDIRRSVSEYKSIREDAVRLYNGGDREVEWQTFFLNNFFAPLANEMKITNEDSRR